MPDHFRDARHDVWLHARKMWEAGLVVASAGNVSRRAGEGLIAITPTSVPYDVMTVEQIVIVDLGTGRSMESTHQPSYELPMHLGVYRKRTDIAAIVHTHSPFVSTLSVLRRPLPPVIDEMMMYLGGQIEVTDYAFTGTDAVGENVVRALGDRAGVILANHGNVCIGKSLERALHVAVTMEWSARIYVQALQLDEPVLLPDDAVRAGRKLYDARRT
jgi:L-ribulose-5-phosphate 4-epimerase